VVTDQYVHQGDVIGRTGGAPHGIGSGPFTTGSHLHFEVRKDGIPVNPINYLP
jgi:murein DD-endopeptidase MepM/ murein hydrolase activator NlpD